MVAGEGPSDARLQSAIEEYKCEFEFIRDMCLMIEPYVNKLDTNDCKIANMFLTAIVDTVTAYPTGR